MSHKRNAFSYHSSLITRHRFIKIDHLDGRHRGLEPLVPGLHPRAVYRLLQRVRGDDAVEHGHARLKRGVRDALRDFARDVLEVRRLPAYDRPQTDYRVEAPRLRELEREQRNLERAGHAEVLDRPLVRAEAFERVERALDETPRQEVVPTARHEREAKAACAQTSLMRRGLQGLPQLLRIA